MTLGRFHAVKVLAAAELYAQNPIALQLRQMNLLYEMNKERGTTVLIPTDMAAAWAAFSPPRRHRRKMVPRRRTEPVPQRSVTE